MSRMGYAGTDAPLTRAQGVEPVETQTSIKWMVDADLLVALSG